MVVIKVEHYDKTYTIEKKCKSVIDIRFYLQFHVPFDDQLLLYNGNLLLDGRTALSDLGIEEEDDNEVRMKVHRKIRPQIITITVHTGCDVLFLEISSVDTVFSLKKMIDEQVGISPRRQNLRTLGVPMYDQWKLERYAISTTPTVFVSETPQDPRWNVAITVEVPTTGQSMVINVEKYDTVHTLHGMIRRAGLADEGRDFHLECAGTRLDGTLDIISYDIESGDTVTLIYH
ncbi:PREDICTED: uncharacterized protein LOC104603573 [Nelumbo nucifera]|uniref:Ubiquitin-like domain-containing protein n=2 Tax=Nelumbo nucifera TaxID=4432 RepID=A0A822YCN9_NELNU|nr:PREDICTED: uncharacterized protein LOC104603573 [Nelumbo nucifera]DAD29883.1 TPA_asm: hypothetical protein HUJ06_031351 [Nelumbo nucifera]